MRYLQKKQAIFHLMFLLCFVPVPSWSLEVTPFAGYRIGGDFQDEQSNTELELSEGSSYGVIVSFSKAEEDRYKSAFDFSSEKRYELIYSHQETEVNTAPTFIVSPKWNLSVDYLHLGGQVCFENNERFQPFISAGMGLTRVEPDEFDAETKFSLSLAGGGRLFLAENFGVRLEARSYWTFFESNSAAFCNNSGCRIFFEGDAWWQFETNVGLFYRF